MNIDEALDSLMILKLMDSWEWSMKRLLLLGGSRYLLPIIEVAHKLGYYVITCDYLPDNIAHKYSDEYCNVSIIDKDAVLEVAKALNIDGILSFACDPGVITAAYVAEKLGIPSAGPYESVCILQNKGKFRKFLSENGFNVPKAESYTSVEEALRDIKMFQLPVIVKPIDSAGSKGVTKVDSVEALEKSIEYALSYSHTKEFIIEEFLEKIGNSSDADSFSVDGELKVISFSAQYFDENAVNPYVPAAFSWPSTISEKNQQELKNEVQRLLRLLNMNTTVYNIETRECKDGKAYIMECSPRGGGNRLAEMLRYSAGIDLITNAVLAAVGEPLLPIVPKVCDGYWAEIILHSNENGILDEVWISDEIVNNVVEKDVWIDTGKEVKQLSGANETIGTLILRFDTYESMKKVLDKPREYVKIIVK